MIHGILTRKFLPGHGRSLARVANQSLALAHGQAKPPGCLGDLGPDDHIVVQSCSKALFASHRGLKCQVSYWLREPRAIQNRFYRSMRFMAHRYAHVLTYDQDLCRTIPNAVFVAHGGCWVSAPSLAGGEHKTDGISIVASPKRDTDGHRLRHQVIEWARQNEAPLTAFGRQYQKLDEKRDAHERFPFSVVIENSRTSNYFTEKLIDSLVCHSLPIYWGAPEIAEYFDPRGLLICESFEDLVANIEACDEKLYQERLPYLEANRLRAMHYVDPHRLVFDSLRGQCELTKAFYEASQAPASRRTVQGLPARTAEPVK